ncbi:MAG TPA: hypothetical protein VJN64_15140 [Terriglobales bacterium]|nr:hypothetical protein [Terriglobales bacterium]
MTGAVKRGADLVAAGRCPVGATHKLACVVCPFGHLIACHHPQTCEQAGCKPPSVLEVSCK